MDHQTGKQNGPPNGVNAKDHQTGKHTHHATSRTTRESQRDPPRDPPHELLKRDTKCNQSRSMLYMQVAKLVQQIERPHKAMVKSIDQCIGNL